MASDRYQSLFKCVGCECQLNKDSKTLPCLHSVCNLCFRNTLEDKETDGKCPECGDGFDNHKPLTLSPILSNELKRQRFTLQEWQCDSCLKQGLSTVPNYWCAQCEKLFCTKCTQGHNQFIEGHIVRNLDEIKRLVAIEMMMGKNCLLHGKAVELFCERCNICYCNTCYKCHSTDPSNSDCMNVPSLIVKDETLKMKTQVPNLEKEMNEFEEILKSSNENLLKYTDELNLECESKCVEIWIKYQQIVENAKLDALDMCKKMRQETAEEDKRRRNILEKNTGILKEVEIWLLNLQHLLQEDHGDREILCGLKLLTSRLPSRHHEWMRPTQKCELSFTLPDWWHQAMKPLVSRQIPSVSCVRKTIPVKKLVTENQWILPGSKSRDIRTIQISEKDNHIFLCDLENNSIIEMSESGAFVSEFLLSGDNQEFKPFDMCSISPDEFVVCGLESKLIFLERIKIHPFLQIQKIVLTKKGFNSLCLKNKTIFTCDQDFEITSFTREGIEIDTMKNDTLVRSTFCPRIRVYFSSGKIWSSAWDCSEMICFNSKGERINSFKKEHYLFDFSLAGFGQFYANCEGIFSFFQQKVLYTFAKRSEKVPLLFVFQNKMFICFQNDGKLLIEVFKIFY